jgi:heat shock protein HtpX
MKGLKRIGIFLLTNLLVMAVLSLILSVIRVDMSQMWGLLIICAVFGFGGSFLSLLLSKFTIKLAYKVQLIDASNSTGKLRIIYDTIRKMAEFRQIKMPQVGIYPSPQPNAFATGATKNSALIAFSSGLVDRLSEEELAAVAGHEMTHVTEGDMVTMTLLMGVVNTFVMFAARVITFAIDMAMRDDRGRGGLGFFGYMLVVMVLQNVLMLLANIPICSYSRYREYRADAGAASLTSPVAMISALRMIDSFSSEAKTRKTAADMAMISNKRRMSIFSTHPSLEQRIERLQKLM